MSPRRAHWPIVVPDTPASSPASEARKLPCGRALVGAGTLLPSHVAMTLDAREKGRAHPRSATNEQDTGNTRVQVALLTAAHQRSDRAPARAQEGPRLASRAADARRPPPPAPELHAEAATSRATASSSRTSACASSAVSIIAAGHARRPEFTLQARGRQRLHARRPAGQDRRPRLLPVRLQPGLHRPVPGLRGGARRDSRRRAPRSTASRRDATLVADGVPREARRHDPAALGLRAQGRGVAGASAPTSSPAA